MDVKKISAEKNAAEDEILSDEQLDSVTGGTNTGSDDIIQLQIEDNVTPQSFLQGGAG